MTAGTPIVIGETDYLVRVPISSLIKAEAELGKPVGRISGAFTEMSVLVKHSLRHADGAPVSKKEFEELLDNLTVEEFSGLFNTVAGCIGGAPSSKPTQAKDESEKN